VGDKGGADEESSQNEGGEGARQDGNPQYTPRLLKQERIGEGTTNE